MSRALLLSALMCGLAARAQETVLPLNAGWTMGRTGDAQRYPAEVPGVVHTDLLRAGAIPDPYYGMNVDSLQWIERTDWTYERTLVVDKALLAHRHIDLVFHGLDTYAEVYLNGVLLGRTDNMFRTWEFPIRQALRPGTARLTVIFRSPITEGMAHRAAYGPQLPADNEAGPEKVSPYIRKAAYQFGWDFAPRLVTSGIWRPVELRCWETVRTKDVRMRPHIDEADQVFVGVDAVILSSRAQAITVKAEVVDGIGVESDVKLRAGADTLHFEVPLPEAQRWWSQGEGERPLSIVRLEGRKGKEPLFRAERRIGVRSIVLDQREDSIGRAFTFVVNGRPVFMKGCNLVPPDMFLPRAGDSAWVALVAQMRQANMDMVRVWAGGVYPPDAFFDACDTAGILVWQDLMFANMTPGDAAFTANVETEVREQVARWGDHPCLALINGNNELDVAWANWGWQGTYGLHGADSARIWNDHVDLFQRRLPAVLGSISDVPYVSTSPLSNWGSTEGLRSGDLHYWGVWHGDSAFSSFAGNTGRFVSEYGFQSYPDSALLARYLPSAALHIGSPELRARQRSYKGDRPILEAIARELGRAPTGLEDFCRASREVQGIAYGMAAEAHLAARPRCMGTLCWQLNTPWPGPSWSLLDHDGTWKPAMEALRAVYLRP